MIVYRSKNSIPAVERLSWEILTFVLDQLCPTQMAYCAKNYATVLGRAAH